MRTAIPFIEDLRTELLTHTPTEQGSRLIGRGIWHRRGPLVAVAVVTVILVGATVWMLRPAGFGPDASEPPNLADWDLSVAFPVPDNPDAVIESVESIPGVAELLYLPDASVLYDDPSNGAGEDVTTTRLSDDGSSDIVAHDIDGASAVLLVRLQPDANPREVAARIERQVDGLVQFSQAVLRTFDSGYISSIEDDAEHIGGDPLLLRPAPGPEPQFDTSPLGRHVPLTASTPIDDLVSWLHSDRDTLRPVIVIGYVAELGQDLVLEPTTRFGYCSFVVSAGGNGGACGIPDGYGFAGGGTPPGHVIMFVPPEASVVVVTAQGADPVWQQPVGGWALLPVKVLIGTATADAYDENGNLIGHWEETF